MKICAKILSVDKNVNELPESIEIQRITPEQWRDYEYIRHTMLKSDSEAFPPQAFEDLKDTESEWVRRINEGIVLVAYDKIEPIGMVRATFEGDKAWVRNMFTLDTYHGMGLEGKLLEKLIAGIQDTGGIRNIELEVEDTQENAIKMYESFSFYEIARVVDVRTINGEKYEGYMITMRKAI